MADDDLYNAIVAALEDAGRGTGYVADANEPDPRYRSYGVRAPAMKQLIAGFKPQWRPLDAKRRLALATRLVTSGYGEQQTVALSLLDPLTGHFPPARFDAVDQLTRHLHGWSKIDAYTGSFLRRIFEAHPVEFLELVKQWNTDEDLWLRRASVVLFTRKVAKAGVYTDTALTLCDNLKHDAQDLVRKGVGWCLKDLMRVERKRVLAYVAELRRQKVSATITLYALRDIKGKDREAVLAAG